MLAAHSRGGVIFFAMVAHLFEHMIVKRPSAALDQQAKRFAPIEVIIKLAVAANTGKGPAVDQTAFPQATQTPVRNILVAACQTHDLRSRTNR